MKDKLPEAIHKLLQDAEYLYLTAEHDKSIEVCNKILQDYREVEDAYELIAASKWRQGKYTEQIEYAEKAIELNNEFYSAYNILVLVILT